MSSCLFLLALLGMTDHNITAMSFIRRHAGFQDALHDVDLGVSHSTSLIKRMKRFATLALKSHPLMIVTCVILGLLTWAGLKVFQSLLK